MNKLFIILLCFYFSNGFSQNAVKNNTWKLIKEDANVQLFSKFEKCDIETEGYHLEFYNLKFVNKTNSAVKIDYNFDIYYNGTCTNCNQNPREDNYSLTLQPNQTIKGGCEYPVKNELTIRSKFYHRPNANELSDFKVNNFNSFKL